MIHMLTSMFPGNDPMSLQMRVSVFHVIFNVTTTALLLPFVSQLVAYSCRVIKDTKAEEKEYSLKYVDERLLSTPTVALMQVKKEMDHLFHMVEESLTISFDAMEKSVNTNGELIAQNENMINFTNSALTKFLIQLTSAVEQSDERIIGSYFHVLNDLERIGDHAENFYEIAAEMSAKKIGFSENGLEDIHTMREKVMRMFWLSKEAFDNLDESKLNELSTLEDSMDSMKKKYIANHFSRLAEGKCSVAVSPYYSSAISGLERVADHLVNVGYSIVSPIGEQ